MTRIRKGIEAIGRRYRLPADMHERVTNEDRRKHDGGRRTVAAAVGILIAVAAVTLVIVAFGGLVGSSTGGPAVPGAAPTETATATPTETATAPPECPPPADKPFEAAWSATAGPAGSLVTVSGPMPLFQEGGKYDPSTEVQAWWNVDPETYEFLTPGSNVAPSPSGPGEIVQLGKTSPDACTFQLEFQIPEDAKTGPYSLVLIGANPEERSITLYDKLTFDVTE